LKLYITTHITEKILQLYHSGAAPTLTKMYRFD